MSVSGLCGGGRRWEDIVGCWQFHSRKETVVDARGACGVTNVSDLRLLGASPVRRVPIMCINFRFVRMNLSKNEVSHCFVSSFAGHSCLIPVDQTTIKMLYVFVDIKIDALHFIETLKFNFKVCIIALRTG